MRRLWFVALVLTMVLVGARPATPSAAAGPTQIYWGAVISGAAYGFGSVPHDLRGVLAFESHAGKAVSLIPFGNSWKNGANFVPFNTAGFDNVRQHGSIPVFSWLSRASDPAELSNANIAAGTADAYIHDWAKAAAAWGHPFFLKFDHEMDGSWFPWGEGRTVPGGPVANGNAPGSYVAMYRHVHDIFVQEGATNVTWAWVVNQESTTGRYPPLSQIYPGDAYVDWTGIDAYNRYPDHWQTFDAMFTGRLNPLDTPTANIYQLVLNVAPTKPIFISEIGAIEDPTNPAAKPAWLRDAILTQMPRNFPAIKAFVYYDDGADNPTLPIESSPAAQSAFANSISLSTYTSNTFGLASGLITTSSEQVAYLTPVADTYIASDQPTSAAPGASPLLSVSGAPTKLRRAYLRFDLTSLAGKTIQQGVLQLSTTGVAYAGSAGVVSVRYDSNNSWKEQYMTWINAGGPFDVAAAPVANLAGASLPATTYVVGLPQALLAAHAGGLLSLQLATTAADAFEFASREGHDPNRRPQLVIAYR